MSTKLPRFGVWAPHYGDWVFDPSVPRTARFDLAKDVTLSAERAGFDTILFAQHTIASAGKHDDEVLEPWTACAAVAALTSKIEIIAAIKPLLYHPVVLAKLALGIEDISHGRFAINLINGWSKPELVNSGIGFPEHDERYAYGREWLTIVKKLIAGEKVTHRGENFQITDYYLKPSRLHRERPYIYAGGESEAARAFMADLVDMHLIRGRDIGEAVELIRDVSSRPRVGKPLEFGTAGFVTTRPTDKEAEEFRLSLEEPLGKITPEERAKRATFVDPKALHGNPLRGAPPAKTETRRLGASGGTAAGFSGSFDTVARRIVDFYEVGLTTFLLTFSPLVAEQELFAQEVIPRVHALIRKKVQVSPGLELAEVAS
jgi:alkanesulfonate monooxygenase